MAWMTTSAALASFSIVAVAALTRRRRQKSCVIAASPAISATLNNSRLEPVLSAQSPGSGPVALATRHNDPAARVAQGLCAVSLLLPPQGRATQAELPRVWAWMASFTRWVGLLVRLSHSRMPSLSKCSLTQCMSYLASPGHLSILLKSTRLDIVSYKLDCIEARASSGHLPVLGLVVRGQSAQE